MSDAKRIFFTEQDYELLESLVDRCQDSAQLELLENELARAEVISAREIPDNVVTLHSRARVIDEVTARERDLTVVPPGEPISAADGKVSVLSPVGSAIIGLSEGQAIEWPMPTGQSRRFRVKKVVYQPQAARRSVRQ